MFEAVLERFGEGNIMASETGETSTGHDAELDELLDSKGWREEFDCDFWFNPNGLFLS